MEFELHETVIFNDRIGEVTRIGQLRVDVELEDEVIWVEPARLTRVLLIPT